MSHQLIRSLRTGHAPLTRILSTFLRVLKKNYIFSFMLTLAKSIFLEVVSQILQGETVDSVSDGCARVVVYNPEYDMTDGQVGTGGMDCITVIIARRKRNPFTIVYPMIFETWMMTNHSILDYQYHVTRD